MVLGSIYAAQITANYAIELMAIRTAIASDDAGPLAVFSMANPNGIFVALESLGYLFQELAILFVAFVFVGGWLERAIRWSFLLNASVATAAMPVNGTLGVNIWAVLFVFSGVLLAVRFARRDAGTAPQETQIATSSTPASAATQV